MKYAGPFLATPGVDKLGARIAAMSYREAKSRSSRLRIFISYRREDTQHVAGRLFDRLVLQFDPAHVFKDVDSIPVGRDFREHLRSATGNCDVMLALIGDRWAKITDASGSLRLDDPSDFVRIELESALERGIPVVPVLVGNAEMPRVEVLPPSLATLTFRQATRLRPDPDFDGDVARIVRALKTESLPVQQAGSVSNQQSQPSPSGWSRRTRPGIYGLFIAGLFAIGFAMLHGWPSFRGAPVPPAAPAGPNKTDSGPADARSIPAVPPAGPARLNKTESGLADARNIAAPDVAAVAAPGRLWAVLIGCEQYHRANRLVDTTNDVRQLSATLKSHCGCDPDDILEMTDQAANPREQPRKASLTAELPAWLKKPSPADTIIVYFSGHGFHDASGKMYLAPLDVDPDNVAATGISVAWFRDQIAACRAGLKFLVLDACRAGSEKGEGQEDNKRQVAAKDLGEPFRDLEGVVTLASSTADQKSQIWEDKQQSLFSYWLVQGLKGHADLDNDGNVDADELCNFVSRQVAHSARLHFPHPQTPVRIVRSGTVSAPVVVHLHPQPMKRVLADMADQLADAAADRQFSKVGVLEFTNITPAGELLGAGFGSMGRYCAEELEACLVSQAMGQFSVVDHRRLQAILSAQQFRLADLASSQRLKSLSKEAGGMPALIHGVLRNRRGRVVNLQCRLVETEGDDMVASVGGTAVINESEWAMFGQSAALKPEDYDVKPQPGAPPRPVADRLIDTLDHHAQGDHPLKDPKFPYRVKLLVDGKERPGVFRGNDLLVPVSKGEVYEILVSNNSGKLVLMRLLVDGLNTLPERVRRKDMATAGEKRDDEYNVAARVDLDDARPWLLDPNDPKSKQSGGELTWIVRGFVTETGVKGKLREFKVVDAAASLAARQQFTDQLGLITAAFYEPGQQRNVGTGMGDERNEVLTERAGPPVGRLRAVVNIRYVDAAELPRQ
jgi:uncharacterized caspase-like protein